jgi:hypothetical protein
MAWERHGMCESALRVMFWSWSWSGKSRYILLFLAILVRVRVCVCVCARARAEGTAEDSLAGFSWCLMLEIFTKNFPPIMFPAGGT